MPIPTSIQDAMRSEHYTQAMGVEIDTLER